MGLPINDALGTCGADGLGGLADDGKLQSRSFGYVFRSGRIYNVEASDVTRSGKPPSRAPSDVLHPDVAHAFWCAVLAAGAPTIGQVGSPLQQLVSAVRDV